MDIRSFKEKNEAAAAAGEALNQLLIENLNQPVLLLLSSDSALSILDYVGPSALGENLTISVLDERFSQDPEVNNFLKLQKHDFYTLAQEKNVSFIGTLPRSGELLEDLVTRWQLALKNWKQENPKGKIFASMGMGADGHTAGIFPYPEDSTFFEKTFENHHWVVGYKATGKNPHEARVTTTLPFFKNIDEAIMFICGQDKKATLERLLKGKEQAHQLPALALYETKHFQIFTDLA